MRGDKHRIGAHVERDRKQIFGRKSQDRPPVRTDVADRFQPEREPFCGVERRKKDEVMHLSYLAVQLVYAADLARNDKARRNGKFAHICKARLFFDAIQPLFRRFERLRKLFAPGGMREVARADKRYALPPCPQIKVGDVGIFARCPRIFGMNM